MTKTIKSKFNPNDKAVYIFQNESKCYEVSNVTIENVLFSKDGTYYWLENGSSDLEESDLYTKEEAIEFLRGVL